MSVYFYGSADGSEATSYCLGKKKKKKLLERAKRAWNTLSEKAALRTTKAACKLIIDTYHNVVTRWASLLIVRHRPGLETDPGAKRLAKTSQRTLEWMLNKLPSASEKAEQIRVTLSQLICLCKYGLLWHDRTCDMFISSLRRKGKLQ